MALSDLVLKVQAEVSAVGVTLNKTESRNVMDAVCSAIMKEVEENSKAAIPNFGTFKVKQRAERTGRNPQTGEALVIPAKTVIAFKAA
jgi:DNA-binding protein HU-beta